MSVFDYLDQQPGAETPQPRMEELWAWARDDYAAGEGADVVCERHRISRSQFFERAKREGWLRRDQPRRSVEPAYDAEAEFRAIEDALDRPPTGAYALARRAWAMAERALLMGRRLDAAGWTRLAETLRKLALQEYADQRWARVMEQNEPSLPPPRSAGGGRDADGGGETHSPAFLDRPLPARPLRHGAEEAPRDLSRSAGEEEGPDSADCTIGPPPLASEVAVKPTEGAGHGEALVPERPPHPDPVPTLAPACAGEAEVGASDSPDSATPLIPANRQERRRLAKLGPVLLGEEPRPGFRAKPEADRRPSPT